MARVVNNVNLDEVEDEEQLEALLDELSIDLPEERKMVRIRLKEIKDKARASRTERMAKLEDSREDSIQKRKREADERKARTLQMFDQMAKSAPAGGHKTMDMSIYKTGVASTSSSSVTVTTGTQPRDMVEECIRDRVKAADDEKKRILAAFDQAAKSSPAGFPKVVDLKNFKKEDAANFELQAPSGVATFSASGGIPKVVKAASGSQPGTPTRSSPMPPSFNKDEPYLEANEREIRARQAEAEENKRRILAGYDRAARSGEAGPKVVYLEEFHDIDPDSEPPARPTPSPTACFSGGVPFVTTPKLKGTPRTLPPGAVVFGKSPRSKQ